MWSRAVDRLRQSESRFVLRHTIQFLTRGHIFRNRIVNRYFSEHQKKKLNIGCGPQTIPGYLNTDVDRTGEIYLDAEGSLPFSSNSFDVVFSGHMIEHISEEAGQQFLNEIYRILKGSGTAIIATPDLERISNLMYGMGDNPDKNKILKKHEDMTNTKNIGPAEYINDMTHREFGHQFIYDKYTLEKSLDKAGFDSVDLVGNFNTNDGELNRYLTETKDSEDGAYDQITMTLEATGVNER